jgi:tetratricopeptide (TPR) repeat protein
MKIYVSALAILLSFSPMAWAGAQKCGEIAAHINPKLALETCSAALSESGLSDATLAEHLFRSAEAYYHSNQIEEALINVNRSLSTRPGYAPALTIRANIHLANGNAELAYQDVTEALSSEPDNVDALYVMASLHMMTNDPAMLRPAENGFFRILQINPEYYSAKMKLANLKIISGQTNEAMKLLDDVIAAGRERVDRAKFLDRTSKVRLYSLFDETRYLKARCLVSIKRYDDAIAEFDKIIAAAPYMPNAHMNRLYLLLVLNRAKEGEADLQALDRLIPGNPEVDKVRYQYLFDIGKRAQARKMLDDIIAGPEFQDGGDMKGWAYYNRGLMRRIQGNFDGAFADIRLSAQFSSSWLKVIAANAHRRGYYREAAVENFSPELAQALSVCLRDPECLKR